MGQATPRHRHTEQVAAASRCGGHRSHMAGWDGSEVEASRLKSRQKTSMSIEPKEIESTDRKWVVLKFGGTSVSEAKTWKTIVAHTRSLLAEDPQVRVWIVVSALSQVTNRLEQCIEEISDYETHLRWIRERHQKLASDLGTPGFVDSQIETLFGSLEKLLAGIELTEDAVSSRLKARVYSYGELLSSTLGYNILRKSLGEGDAETTVSWVDARECLFAENRLNVSLEDKYLNAYVSPKIDPAAAEKRLHRAGARVAITQGFIATTRPSSKSTKSGTCVLGRGGGDISGALFACLLNAARFEVWTDVHGMFTSDPRYVKQARHILELSYREAQELAAMGAKVMNPRSLVPASYAKIPVQIHNTMDFENREQFTSIVSPEKIKDKETTVMAITRRLDQVLLTLSNVEMWGASGFLSKAFEPFDKYNVSVDLIATSQYAVSLTLDYIPGGVNGDVFSSLLHELRKVARVDVHQKCAVVSIVGRRLRTVLHLMADAFRELAQYNVLLVSESTEDLNLSFVVAQEEGDSVEQINKLVSKLHKVLLEDKCGLPSPGLECSLFGSTFRELLNIAPDSPEVFGIPGPLKSLRDASKDFDLDVSVDSVVLDEGGHVDQAFRNAPVYSVFDVELLAKLTPKLRFFSLRLTCDPVILKFVLCLNRELIFVLENEVHRVALSRAFLYSDSVGPINVALLDENGMEKVDVLPSPRFNLVEVSTKEVWEEVAAFNVHSVRKVVAKVAHIDAQRGRMLLNMAVDGGEVMSQQATEIRSIHTICPSRDQSFHFQCKVFARNRADPYGPAVEVLSQAQVGGAIVEQGSRVTLSTFPLVDLYYQGQPVPGALQ